MTYKIAADTPVPVTSTSADGDNASIGATTDAEALGNGSLIAIAKRQRTVLGTIAALLAATIVVSGTVSIGNSPTVQQGTPPWQDNVTQIAGSAITLGSKTSANSLPVVVASDQGAVNVALASAAQLSIGSSTGKANVLKTGSLTTTAVTADQVVLTYTVTAGKTFYLEYVAIQSRLTVLAATASILGAASVEAPSGTKVITQTFVNPTTSAIEGSTVTYSFAEPIPLAAASVIRVVTTPGSTTSTLWIANFGGYEK